MPAEEYEDDGSLLNWQDYYHAVRERWWMVMLALVLAVIGGIGYLSQQQVTFRAKSVIMVEKDGAQVLDDVEGVAAEGISGEDMINTIVDSLNSFIFATRVASALELHQHPAFLNNLSPEQLPVPSAEVAAGMMSESVNASYRNNTRLIDIVVVHPDKGLAQQIANAYAQEYIAYTLDQRRAKAQRYNDYLMEEAEKQREAMRLSEEAMQSFRERERSASLESMQTVAEEQLDELNLKISQLEDSKTELGRDLVKAREVGKDTDQLLQLPSVAKQERVAALTEQLAVQRRSFTLLQQRYRHLHPKYIAAETTIEELEQQRRSVLREAVSLLQARAEQIDASLATLRENRERLQQRLLEVTSKTVEYNDLRRELETDRALYDAILERIKEIDVAEGVRDSPLDIHELAMGAKPQAVERNKIMLASVMLGLIGGIGIAIGLNFLDHSVKTVDQAEDITGLSVIAAVPEEKKLSKNKWQMPVTLADKQGIIAESFRSLRTSLTFTRGKQNDDSVFLFTSALPGEGKTFCSTNLAITMAQSGYKVLLVDADLRKPMVSRVLFGERMENGLVNYLQEGKEWPFCTYETEQPNLDVLPSGTSTRQPLELLASERFGQFVEEAREQYDRIVIDTPPVLAVSDTMVIAQHVDGVSIVAKAFSTARKNLERAIKAFREADITPKGVVLNSLPSGRGSYYYYYYSGKYYGAYAEKGNYGEN